MKNLSLFTLLFLAGAGCNYSANKETIHERVVIVRDTVYVNKVQVVSDTTYIAPPSQRTSLPVPVKKETTTPTKVVVIKDSPIVSTLDTQYYYYINKKVSVKVTPWQDSKSYVLLYDLYGKETYRMEQSRMHMHSSVDLKFHDNGAVSLATISGQPDGGIQRYKTVITFSTVNEPVQKNSEDENESFTTKPQPWYYWNKQTKQWQKQEVME